MINLIKAIYHWSQLRKDNSKDVPKRVFKIITLLGKKRYLKTKNKFFSNPENVKLLNRDKTLSTLIKDYNKFKKYKKGTLGRELYEFLKSEDIDYAKAIIDFGNFIDKYDKRERDMHDITHVIFGYSRSRFGEGATIITQYWQGGFSGFGFITFIGFARQAIKRPSTAKILLKGLKDVYERQKGVKVSSYPFEDNFKKNIDVIRNELNIPEKTFEIKILDKLSD